jgi:hypothetical protein
MAMLSATFEGYPQAAGHKPHQLTRYFKRQLWARKHLGLVTHYINIKSHDYPGVEVEVEIELAIGYAQY